MKRTYLYLAIITAVGALMRVYLMGRDSLWLDTSYTVTMSSNSFADIWSHWILDVHPPLYYFIQHVMFYITGPSEWGIQVFPVMCGIVTIPIFYLIGKEALDENSGLLMAAMLTVSQLAIHYSTEARMYAPMLLCLSIAFYFWLKFVKEDHTRYLLYFAFASAVAIWFHFFSVIPFLIFLIFLPRWLDRVDAMFLTGLLCLPLVLPAIQMSQHQLGLQVTGLIGLDVANGTLWQLAGFNPIGFLLLITLFIIGTYELYQYNKRLALLCAAMVIGSLAFGCVISTIGVHNEARYYIYLLPMFFIPIAAVVKEIGGKK
jgi:mannosyltransferase